MIDEIPIPRAILSQAIAIGFNLDQVGGHFGLCIGDVLTLPSLTIQRESHSASFGFVRGLSTALGQCRGLLGLQVAQPLPMAFGAMTTRPDVLEAARNGSNH